MNGYLSMRKPHFPLFIFLLFGFCRANAQIDFRYGLTLGVSKNEKNEKKSYTIPELRNAQVVHIKKGFTSPVIGIHASAGFKYLYSCVGLEFNQTGQSAYNFESREYYKQDGNGVLNMKRYYNSSSVYCSLSKLNVPIELGIQILRERDFSPFIFAGINFNYILKANFTKIDTTQDVFWETTDVKKISVNVYDQQDDYVGAQRGLRKQFILGAGLNFRKHLSLKVSRRSQNSIGVWEQNDPDIIWNCFGGHSFLFVYKEVLLTLSYHF